MGCDNKPSPIKYILHNCYCFIGKDSVTRHGPTLFNRPHPVCFFPTCWSSPALICSMTYKFIFSHLGQIQVTDISLIVDINCEIPKYILTYIQDMQGVESSPKPVIVIQKGLIHNICMKIRNKFVCGNLLS